MTPADLIGQYIKLRDKRDEIQKAFEAQLEQQIGPYKVAMETIENALTEQLLALSSTDEGKRNISTDAGVAFRQRWTSPKVEDRVAWLEFVINTESTQFLTNHVSKEAIAEYMAEHNQQTPPGIKFEHGYKTIVRRA